MPRVVLNGEARMLPDGATAADAVHAAGAPAEARGVAVALAGEVVPRGAWRSTRLAEGDQVEVVGAVAGG